MYELDPKYTARIVENGEYSRRIFDSLSFAGPELFARIYKDRNNNVLSRAIPTNIYDSIVEYIVQAKHTILMESDAEIKIVINSYPYELDAATCDLLKLGIAKHINNIADVEIVRMATNEITPTFIDDNFGFVIMYDLLPWVDYHVTTKQLVRHTLPDVTFLTPALIGNRDVLARQSYEKFFNDISQQLGIFVGIVFEHPSVFSIHLNKK